jgi:hypothetical protein
VHRTFGLVAADGSAYRTLEADTTRDGGPVLAPDGRSVAWVAASGREVRVLRFGGAREVTLTLPADAVDAVRWFPDSARLLVAGRTAAGPAAWAVPAAGGTAVEACRCPYPLLSQTGTLVDAAPPVFAGDEVAAGPDGASWAYVDAVAAQTVVAGAAGERRFGADVITGYAPRYLVSWTRDGVWVGRDGGVDLLDPSTGRHRPALAVDRAVSRVRGIAVDLAPGVVSAPAADEVSPRPWYRSGRWWPGGVAVLAGLAGLAGLAAAVVYRTRRIRAMQAAPTAASTRETTNSAR